MTACDSTKSCTPPPCARRRQFQNQLKRLREYQYQFQHRHQDATNWKVELAPQVHGWKRKTSTDRLSLHSCLSPSTLLNARDPTFPTGAGRHGCELVETLSILHDRRAGKVSRTPACHVNNTLWYRSAPSARSLPPAAQGADLGWKLDGSSEWDKGQGRGVRHVGLRSDRVSRSPGDRLAGSSLASWWAGWRAGWLVGGLADWLAS